MVVDARLCFQEPNVFFFQNRGIKDAPGCCLPDLLTHHLQAAASAAGSLEEAHYFSLLVGCYLHLHLHLIKLLYLFFRSSGQCQRHCQDPCS